MGPAAELGEGEDYVSETTFIRRATLVPTLTAAWEFVMRELDRIPEPTISIQPIYTDEGVRYDVGVAGFIKELP